MSALRTSNLQILRGLIRELKKISTNKDVNSTAAYSYVLEQFRGHQVTSQKVCRGENEMRHLGATYLCYLNSNRKTEELAAYYRGDGERSVKSTANMVGFRLPDYVKPE